MVSQTLYTGFNFYQSANTDARIIKDSFLIRIHEYEVIMNDIRRNPMNGSVQHYLLLGRRGSGKSTLLKRLQVEIDTDEQLSKTHTAINLAEEQANIYRLCDLLEEIIYELDYRKVEVEHPEWEDDIHSYSRELFAAIHSAIEKSGKKVILLLDNIDRIFENLHEEASLLREYLLNYDDIKIVGGSTRMTEHFWKYNKPFYEFFRVLELKPLNSIEIRTLLLNWSERLNLPELKDFVENKPGQLETIRILTDGLPRTLQFFVNILLTHTQETGYEYLRLIMDSVTPLYQERLNTLPPSQRKIVLQMAFIWESAGAKEIAEATKMDNKVISAQLKQLIEKGIAEKIETNTKNHLYRLSERFFNLWLIFTQGSPKEKRRAKWLTIFLENFYSSEELNIIASEHLKTLKDGTINANKAALLTKAYAQSKYISSFLREALITTTLELGSIDRELKSQLPETTTGIFENALELYQKKGLKEAVKKIKEIEQDDGIRDLWLGILYQVTNNLSEAEKCFYTAITKGMKIASYCLADLYKKQGKYELAEEFYIKADELNFNDSSFKLAKLYDIQDKYELAEKYYLKAVEQKIPRISVSIAQFYFKYSKFENAERYFKIGIEEKEKGAYFGLAITYYFQNKSKGQILDLIKTEKEFGSWEDTNLYGFEIILYAWAGQFEELNIALKNYISKQTYKDFEVIIRSLLVHHQNNIVVKLFYNNELGQELTERFQPLHYAANLIIKKDSNTELKIPPELQDTVNKILEEIKQEQRFYYGE